MALAEVSSCWPKVIGLARGLDDMGSVASGRVIRNCLWNFAFTNDEAGKLQGKHRENNDELC